VYAVVWKNMEMKAQMDENGTRDVKFMSIINKFQVYDIALIKVFSYTFIFYEYVSYVCVLKFRVEMNERKKWWRKSSSGRECFIVLGMLDNFFFARKNFTVASWQMR
jgi:hypothetical protein